MSSSERKKQTGKKRKRTEETDSLKVPEIIIQNVVSTFYLGRKKINLKKICSKLKFLEFNP